MTSGVASALLLDVGHVIIEPSWRAVRAYEAATGTTMPHPADVAVAMDHGWQTEGDVETVGDRYWDEVAKLAGHGGIVGMFRALGKVVPEAMFDVDAVALMDDTRAAGLPVGILTNHAYMILGREWFAARPEFAGLATFIDAAEIGCPKPDPQAYLTAANELGVPPGRSRLPRRHTGLRRGARARRDARGPRRPDGPGRLRSSRRGDCSVCRETATCRDHRAPTAASGSSSPVCYASRGDEVWAGCRRPAEATELRSLTSHVHRR